MAVAPLLHPAHTSRVVDAVVLLLATALATAAFLALITPLIDSRCGRRDALGRVNGIPEG